MNVALSPGQLHDQVCIVTGANSGVGKEVARALLHADAHLVMVCRHAGRAEAARSELRLDYPDARIDLHLADLSSLDDIRLLAALLLKHYPRINLLINNAGGHITDRQTSRDGNEMNLALNVLGPFLLTQLLQERLQQSAPSRIVNVASEAHRIGSHLAFDDFQNAHTPQILAYMRAKFYLMLLTQAQARRLEGTQVSCHAVCPGLVASNFYRGGTYWLMKGLAGARIFTIISPKAGATSTLQAATDSEYGNSSGQFIGTHPLTRWLGAAPAVFDIDKQEQLWRYLSDRVALSRKQARQQMAVA